MDKKQLSLFVALAKIAAANANGFTVDRDNLQPITTGFSVAVAETQNSFNVVGLANVIKYVCTHPEINAFGGWYNSENGRFYFDATIVCYDKKTALELGRIHKQLAIFDLNNLEEIKL